MNAAENAILSLLLHGQYADALAALDDVSNPATEELLRTLVLGLSEASGYIQTLCEGRLAVAPPCPDNPFCNSLKRLQNVMGHRQQAEIDETLETTHAFNKDIETGLLSRRSFLWEVRDLLEKQPVPSLTILTTALWIALGGRKKLERKEAEELATDYFRENGIEGMTKLFYATLGASGVLGKATTNELFKQFGLGEYADEAESTEEQAEGEGKRKNVRKARA